MDDAPLRNPLGLYAGDRAAAGPVTRGRTLAGLIGAVAAAIALTVVPREESGRTVEVAIAPDKTATVRHVAGKQYLKAYLDIAGVPTACDGITAGVRLGQSYTEAQCAALLERELLEHAEGMMRCSPGLRSPGMDYPRAAALSLTYNIGVGAFCRSSVRQRFDRGDVIGGCNGFLAWNKARVNGVLRPVAGLTARRQRERTLCMKGLVL